jgi:CheY-like chemotaxis protein/HPt (histidine-containing phosphotransfer) domain-containing protein
MMGGSMWVESDGESGSTFYFTLVTRPAVSSARLDLDTEQPQLDGKRLLIVDDNATNRQTIVQQTRGWGMVAREVSTARQALEVLRSGENFEMAIIDTQMAGTNTQSLAEDISRLPVNRSLPLVGLCPLGQRAPEGESAHFAAFLTKPIKQSQLYNVLVDLFTGRDSTERVAHETTSESSYDNELGSRFPLRILLAEDMTVNQKLVQKMLSKMGYQSDVVSDGQQVLEALTQQAYDVVLMDIQMPVMDGLETSQQIAARWAQDERPRIVALTANAMREDREACMAAGMDDYIAKPVRVAELQNALTRCGEWAQQRRGIQKVAEHAHNTDTHQNGASEDVNNGANPTIEYSNGHGPNDGSTDISVADLDPSIWNELRAMRDSGSPDIIRELLEAFEADGQPLLLAMREAVRASDAKALWTAAHGLKGAAANLGGQELAILCQEMEKVARIGNVGDESSLSRIETAFERLRFALQFEAGGGS